jgi:hypothetical protein
MDGRRQRSALHAEDVFRDVPVAVGTGEEPEGNSRIEAIAEAALRLDELGRNWLNPEGASKAEPWLENVHKKLDVAVFAAYGWPSDLSDEEVLQNLLALNLERSNPR